MRTTLSIDDDLFQQALAFSAATDNASVLREALQTYVRVEAGKRLAALGGQLPMVQPVPRRRPAGKSSTRLKTT